MRDPLVGLLAGALDEAAVAAGAAVLVGCSGGPDSMALAHGILALRAAGRLGAVTLAHVDHGLRTGSAGEAERVRSLAAAHGAEVRCAAVAVARRGGSLEAAARAARLAALERLADEVGAAWILLGHTASDQAETVLMRILRGTGVAGLAGIPARRGRLLRPLLGATRDQVLAYVARHQLDVLDDPMNRDEAYTRSRIRHRWLPALRAENPAIERALVRLAEAAAAERTVLDWTAGQLLDRAAVAGRPGAVAAAVLAAAPASVTRRALALLVERAGGTPAANALADLHRLASAPDRGSRSLDLHRARAVREYGILWIEPARAPLPEAVAAAAAAPPAGHALRAWQPGDRMRPRRLRGRSRKLSDLFADARVPRRLRGAARVLLREADGAIVWAEHLGLAIDADPPALAGFALTDPDREVTNKS